MPETRSETTFTMVNLFLNRSYIYFVNEVRLNVKFNINVFLNGCCTIIMTVHHEGAFGFHVQTTADKTFS